MNDTKNILLAWISSLSSIFAAIETRTWITIISAIVLPMVFFTLGKTVDVLLQVYFRRRDQRVRTGSGGLSTGRVLPGQNRRVKCQRVTDLVTTVSSGDLVKRRGGGNPVGSGLAKQGQCCDRPATVAPGSDQDNRENKE